MPCRKNPHGEKYLCVKIPAGKYPRGEYQNVNIYLKHTQMCQTDCKSEPKLDFRPLNRCFKKSPRGFFLRKSLREKIPAGKNEKLLFLVDIHFYTPLT